MTGNSQAGGIMGAEFPGRSGNFYEPWSQGGINWGVRGLGRRAFQVEGAEWDQGGPGAPGNRCCWPRWSGRAWRWGSKTSVLYSRRGESDPGNNLHALSPCCDLGRMAAGPWSLRDYCRGTCSESHEQSFVTCFIRKVKPKDFPPLVISLISIWTVFLEL